MRKLLAHKLVEEVSDERSLGDGIFCYLVKGYCRDDGAHAVHADTIKECLIELKYVQECSCDWCRS